MKAQSVLNTRRKRKTASSARFALMLVLTFLCSLYVEQAQGQRGAITLPRNLSELTSSADRIVQGKITEARVEPLPAYRNIETVVVTVAVDETLKGPLQHLLTFRQFIWDKRDIAEHGGYRIGEPMILFLNKQTSIGLTSPVGLGQGRFRITRDRMGNPAAINDNGNSGLMHGMTESSSMNTANLSPRSRSVLRSYSGGALPLDTLKESVKALVQSQGRAK